MRDRVVFLMSRAAGALLAFALLLPAIWHVRTLTAVFAERLAYPTSIEWMEGGHLAHAFRISHGLPLYTDPASGFAPFPYPPLFWMLIAAASRVFGLSYATGRGVSVACVAGSALVLAVAVARRAPARWVGVTFGLVAVASIGAGYPFSEGSLDLARSDACATFAAIVAAALAGDGRLRPARELALAGALVAAVYAKQTNVFVAAWIVVFVFARDPKRGLRLAATTLAAGGALFAWAYAATHGWFFTWLVDMGHHGVLLDAWADPIAPFVRHDPFLLFLPLLVGWLRWKRRLRAEAVKWVGALVAAIAGALLAKMKRGGWVNVYVPVLVLSWPVVLYLAADALSAIWPRRVRALAATWAALLAASVTLRLLEYHTHSFVPTAEQRREADAIAALVRSLDGDVVVTTDAFVALDAGKRCTQPMLQAYFDAAAAGMRVDYADALDRSGATWVITTGVSYEAELGERLAPRFERVRDLDIRWGSLGGWDRGNPKTLFRRRPR